MPLVWAHAEYLKLRRSLATGTVFDLPPQTVRRYGAEPQTHAPAVWRRDLQLDTIGSERTLRIEVPAPAEIVWSVDDWRTTRTTMAIDAGHGLWYADLQPSAPGVDFTMRWPDHWEGTNYRIRVIDGGNV